MQSPIPLLRGNEMLVEVVFNPVLDLRCDVIVVGRSSAHCRLSQKHVGVWDHAASDTSPSSSSSIIYLSAHKQNNLRIFSFVQCLLKTILLAWVLTLKLPLRGWFINQSLPRQFPWVLTLTLLLCLLPLCFRLILLNRILVYSLLLVFLLTHLLSSDLILGHLPLESLVLLPGFAKRRFLISKLLPLYLPWAL